MAHEMTPIFNESLPDRAGVKEAISWLMGNASDDVALREALTVGLVIAPKGGRTWRTNGEELAKLAEERLRASCPPSHGIILVGLDEMLRCTHTGLMPSKNFGKLLCRSLTYAKARALLKQVLNATKCVHAAKPKANFVYTTQAFDILDWTRTDIFWNRASKLRICFGSRGLDLSISTLLRHGPPVLIKWFLEEAEKRSCLEAAINSAEAEIVASKEVALRSIRSNIPLFVALACLQLIGDDATGIPASKIDAILRRSGAPKAGRVSIAVMVLRRTAEAWRGVKDRPQRNIEQQTELKMGNGLSIEKKFAEARLESLQAELGILRGNKSKIKKNLDDALGVAANLDSANAKNWDLFEPCIGDSPELKHAFAVAHKDCGAREVALKNSRKSFEDVLQPGAEDWTIGLAHRQNTAYWASQSQLQIPLNASKTKGHAVAKRLQKPEAHLRAQALQPFAASRFGDKHQFTLKRWALLLEFALFAVLSIDPQEGTALRDLTLSSAETFLKVADQTAHELSFVDRISELTASALRTCDASTQTRWIEDVEIPTLLRVLLAWGRYDFLAARNEEAIALLDEVEDEFRLDDEMAKIFFIITDCAAAACYTSGVTELGPIQLNEPYQRSIIRAGEKSFLASIDYSTLLAAVSGDKTAQNAIVSNPVWSQKLLGRALSQ